jgi:hypothetical protein
MQIYLALARKDKVHQGFHEVSTCQWNERSILLVAKPWTEKSLIFDNSYSTVLDNANADDGLLQISLDQALYKDEAFQPFDSVFSTINKKKSKRRDSRR